jgi:hypothetical protein
VARHAFVLLIQRSSQGLPSPFLVVDCYELRRVTIARCLARDAAAGLCFLTQHGGIVSPPAELIVADSGVRITAARPQSDELFALFQTTSIICTLTRNGAGDLDVIDFHSPYDVGRVLEMFTAWQHKAAEI